MFIFSTLEDNLNSISVITYRDDYLSLFFSEFISPDDIYFLFRVSSSQLDFLQSRLSVMFNKLQYTQHKNIEGLQENHIKYFHLKKKGKLFTKVVPKLKTEYPGPLQSWRIKCIEGQEDSAERHLQTHTNRSACHPPSRGPRHRSQPK